MPARRFFAAAEKSSQRTHADSKRRIVSFHGVDQGHQRPEIRLTDDTLLTTEQVRVRLGLGSLDAVYRLVRDHDLPRLTLGGLYRFSQTQVEAWIAEQSQANVQPGLLVRR